MAYQNVTPMLQETYKKTWFQKFRGRVTAAGAATTGLILANSAHADADLTSVGTAVTTQLGSAGTIVVTILVAAASLTALIIGYRKINKGANAA